MARVTGIVISTEEAISHSDKQYEGTAVNIEQTPGTQAALSHDIGGGVVVTDCVFQNNTGGSYVFQSSVIFTANYFMSNIGVQGGGFFMLSSSAVLIGNNFTSNRASLVGGGLDFFRSNVTFQGETNFLNNTAVGFGGGLFMQSSTLEVLGDIVFNGNSAGTLGGAILMLDQTNVSFAGRVTVISAK